MSMVGPDDVRRASRGAPTRPPLAAVALGLVAASVTLLFVWSVWAFVGPILWRVVAAIMFAPLNDHLLALAPRQRNLAAILTLLVVIAMGVLPAVIPSVFLLDQAGMVYAAIRSGQIDIPATFNRVQAILPGWMTSLMHRIGITDLDSLREQFPSASRTACRC
jgi:predicted PurR-regulated permease PerM